MIELSPEQISEAKRIALKKNSGKTLTKAEQKKLETLRVAQAIEALTKVDNDLMKTKFNDAVEQLILYHLQRMRPKFFVKLLAIQHKQRQDMADRYGFECGAHQETINFVDVVSSMRKLIADHAQFFNADSAEDSPDLAKARLDKTLKEKEKLEVQIEQLRLQLDDLKNKLVPVEVVEELLNLTAGEVRKASSQMQKDGHSEAYEILTSALDVADRNCARLIDDSDVALVQKENDPT